MEAQRPRSGWRSRMPEDGDVAAILFELVRAWPHADRHDADDAAFEDQVLGVDPKLAGNLMAMAHLENELQWGVVEHGKAAGVDLRNVAEAGEAALDVLLVPMLRWVAGDRHLDQPVGGAEEAVGSFLGALEFQLRTLKRDGAKRAHQLTLRAHGEPEKHRATPRGEELYRYLWEHGGNGSADERSDIATNLWGRDDGESQARRHLRPAPGELDLEGLHAPFPVSEVGADRAIHRLLVAVRASLFPGLLHLLLAGVAVPDRGRRRGEGR
jgi:hypothetical protein